MYDEGVNNVGCKWTVYIHINKVNLKSYVGITCKDPVRRWGTTGNGYNTQVFGRAVQKYGWDNFSHIIVAKDLDEETAKYIEILLIEKLSSHISKNGYNVTLGGDGYLGCDNHGEKNPMYGRHHSEETKELLSRLNRNRPSNTIGRKHTDEERERMRGPRPSVAGKNNPRYGTKLSEKEREKKRVLAPSKKPVVQLDFDWNYIKEYMSEIEAERQTGLLRATIRNCCNCKQSSSGGYYWVFKEDFPVNDEHKKRITLLRFKHGVQKFSHDGKLISEYLSVTQAGRIENIDRHKISNACKTKEILEGYYWLPFNYTCHLNKTLCVNEDLLLCSA